MTPIPIPSAVTQTARNAHNDLGRVAMTLTTMTTFNGLCAAENALTRAMDEARKVKAHIRHLKSEAKREEARQTVEKAIVARDAVLFLERA